MTEQIQSKSDRQRWVVKLGSALLTNNGLGLAVDAIAAWVGQIVRLRELGVDIVVVSSGAVAEGVARLGWQKRPQELHKLQAAAAVGQMGLGQAWQSHFAKFGAHTALVLLTSDDVANRKRYLNARKTLNTLLSLGVIPVVNENDTVATEELCFGDNDQLAALVANLVDADRLLILTDQQGLFDADPRDNPGATLIAEARASDEHLLGFAGSGKGELGRGGMRTKVLAARQAATSGANTHIVDGSQPDLMLRLARGEQIGSLLLADRKPAVARKQWIAGQSLTRGQLVLDAGAVKALCDDGKSLLPIGVTACQGVFDSGDVVACCGPDGKEVARGLVNYSLAEAQQIIGLASAQIAAIFDRPRDKELIHRDNLVVL